MSIHEHLPPRARKELKEVGWAKGDRTGEAGEAGQAELRLCNLVAQSPSDAEEGLQEGGREGIDGEGNGAGDCLLQSLPEPDAGH